MRCSTMGASVLLLSILIGCSEPLTPPPTAAPPEGVTGAVTLVQGSSLETLCEVFDAQGDAFWQGLSALSAADAVEVPPYRDIIRIEARRSGTILTFSMDMAGQVPTAPTMILPVVKEMIWFWRLDTDPTTAPAGYPTAPGDPVPHEFMVRIVWDGARFRGELIDRRPLLTGGSAIVLPMPFQISGATLSVSVDSHALGDPEAFRLAAGATDWQAQHQHGNLGLSPLDGVRFTACPAL